MSPRSAIAIRAGRWRASRRRAWRHEPSPVGPICSGAATAVISSRPETRIGGGVEQVRDDPADDNERAADDYFGEDEWIVARAERGHGDAPHSRPAEHLLDEHGAAEERRKGEADDGDQ